MFTILIRSSILGGSVNTKCPEVQFGSVETTLNLAPINFDCGFCLTGSSARTEKEQRLMKTQKSNELKNYGGE